MVYFTIGNSAGFHQANGPKIRTGQWYHVVGVCDGENASFYVDGELKGSVSAGLPAPSPCNFKIGVYALYNAMQFNGVIDEVTVYNRALSEEEIGTRYESGNPK